jgi:hypothetical protein
MDGCDASIGTNPCNAQNAAYYVGRMRQWGLDLGKQIMQ